MHMSDGPCQVLTTKMYQGRRQYRSLVHSADIHTIPNFILKFGFKVYISVHLDLPMKN